MSRSGRIIQVVDPSTTSNLSGLWGLNEILGYVNQTKWPRGPEAPTNLTTAAGNTQLALGWTAPTTTHGNITNYLVEYTPSGSSAQYVLTNSTSTSYTLTGLTNGTTYTVRVAAVNFAVGDWSGTATGTPEVYIFFEIPEMTSNTTPSGTVLTFGNIRNGFLNDGSAAAWFWFSRKNSGGSSLPTANQPVNTNNSGIGYRFALGESFVSGFEIAQSTRVTNHYASSFEFSGSNDGSNWTQLSTHSGLTNDDWPGGVVKTFSVATGMSYSRYRWMITGAPNSYVEWSKVQLRS